MTERREYDSVLDTHDHIRQVQNNLQVIINDLFNRALVHDDSKLRSPEKETFDKYTPMLKIHEYGSDGYKQCVAEMQPALVHHYANNDHHADHFVNGIKDMNLIQLVEMLADWKAATMRNPNGDIMKSIEYNQTKCGYSDELKNILINTVKYLEWI